ncbi:MAG: EAL domain-containing protein, partial [Tardiphaga sp.]|uniref:putative bifunctional diguanylate cyclase/phosphodiesterase n=1 Tax=Tardiphaga sp. TaxID=1926292 RepID=UPI00199CCA4F
YLPGCLDAICLMRMAMWWLSHGRTASVNQAIRRLRSTIVLAGLLGIGFVSWSIWLFPYGDAYMQGQVIFFTGATVIGCGFCLMHLRPAALLVMTLVVIPFTVFLLSSGHVILVLIAINFFIVSVAVTFMLLTNYADFEKRVISEDALRSRQAELQAMSDINFRNSNIDSLTGLPNRRCFFSELNQQIAASDTTSLVVAILDLDGFKQINDVHGHPAGDRLLRSVGDRLRAHLHPSMFLGRLGGDEFVMIAPPLRTPHTAADAGDELAAVFMVPFEFDGVIVKIGCTIGYAEYPTTARTADELFERADYALFFAKKHGRGTVVGFSAEHENTIREASLIDQALLNADLESELWVAYQPIVDGSSAQAVSFEALARWNSPVLGNVPPMSFIVAAERLGLIGQLTPLLLRKALEGAAAWPDDMRVSFNLSRLDIASPLSILKIISVVEHSGIDPSRIDFEITETAVMHNIAEATIALNVLKRLGARISLDDFGTGYSSLSCIRELPLDKVKIDRSFISEIEYDTASRLILTTIIGLCRNLGLECIVEGVETAEQAEFLHGQGCRFMQGYHFGKPMSRERVGGFLAAPMSNALAAPVQLHRSATPRLASAL